MPIYDTNPTVDNAATAGSGDVFIKVGKGESGRFRKLPALVPSGQTVFRQELHYKLKNPDSEDGKGSFVHACDNYHGDGDCFMCKVFEVLSRSTDPAEKALTEYPDSVGAQVKTYVPVLQYSKDGYSDPKMLSMGRSGGEAFATATRESQSNDLPLVEDVKFGQDVVVSLPKGPGPYKVSPTGVQKALDEIADEDLMKKINEFDPMSFLKCTVRTKDELKAAIRHTFPSLDWDSIFEEAEAL